MDWFTKATISMRLVECPPWKNVFKCARTVQDADFGGTSLMAIRGAVSKKERAANLFGVLVSLQGTSLDVQNVFYLIFSSHSKILLLRFSSVA